MSLEIAVGVPFEYRVSVYLCWSFDVAENVGTGKVLRHVLVVERPKLSCFGRIEYDRGRTCCPTWGSIHFSRPLALGAGMEGYTP